MDKIEEAREQFDSFVGLPFRKYQKEAVEFIVNSDKKYVVLSAPTGSGKSLIAMVAGKFEGGATYMVHSKSLQNQITEKFPSPETESLFGRSNYECIVYPMFTCDECPLEKCPDAGSCLYTLAKKRAQANQMRILNYDYFLTEANYIGEFSGQKLIIIDEADNLENSMLGFISLTITKRDFEVLKMDSPTRRVAGKTPEAMVQAFRAFARVAIERANDIKAKLQAQIPSDKSYIDDRAMNLIKQGKKISRLIAKLKIFVAEVDPTWIYQEDRGNHTFRPIWLTEGLCKKYLWDHGVKFVMMSASFLPIQVFCKTLGLDQTEVDYMELPSTFDPDRMKVYVEPVAALNSKNKDESLPLLVPEIKSILGANLGIKGIIHGVSYELCRYIIDNVNDNRLFMHESGMDRQEKIDQFLNGTGDEVLVSPSLERGLSLDADLCRFVIIPKAPYLNLGDKVTNARLYSGNIGKLWYQSMMLLSVLQGAGRAMRSEDDWCRVYVLDGNVERAIQGNPRLLPQWFRDRIRIESWRQG